MVAVLRCDVTRHRESNRQTAFDIVRQIETNACTDRRKRVTLLRIRRGVFVLDAADIIKTEQLIRLDEVLAGERDRIVPLQLDLTGNTVIARNFRRIVAAT